MASYDASRHLNQMLDCLVFTAEVVVHGLVLLHRQRAALRVVAWIHAAGLHPVGCLCAFVRRVLRE
jgi:hypothetical protein